jgi:hypothetical protein
MHVSDVNDVVLRNPARATMPSEETSASHIVHMRQVCQQLASRKTRLAVVFLPKMFISFCVPSEGTSIECNAPISSLCCLAPFPRVELLTEDFFDKFVITLAF